MRAPLALAGLLLSTAWAAEPIRLSPGYIYKVRCEGRLLVSAIGNDSLLRLEALPKEVGCGALLKALGPSGTTNLLLETSTGSIQRLIEIGPKGGSESQAPLEIWVKTQEAGR